MFLFNAIYTAGEMLMLPTQAALMMQHADHGRAGHAFRLMCALLGGVAMAVQYTAIRQMQSD